MIDEYEETLYNNIFCEYTRTKSMEIDTITSRYRILSPEVKKEAFEHATTIFQRRQDETTYPIALYRRHKCDLHSIQTSTKHTTTYRDIERI